MSWNLIKKFVNLRNSKNVNLPAYFPFSDDRAPNILYTISFFDSWRVEEARVSSCGRAKFENTEIRVPVKKPQRNYSFAYKQ